MGNIIKRLKIFTGGSSSSNSSNTIRTTGTISSAEITAGIGATAIKTLVAAPGAGYMICPKFMLVKYNYGSAAYNFLAVGSDSYIVYSGLSFINFYVANIPTVLGLFDGTTDVQWSVLFMNTANALPTVGTTENRALEWYRDANAPSTGNGTIDYILDYEIIAV